MVKRGRGRPEKDPANKKDALLSTRVSSDLKGRLQKVAFDHDLSLSKAIEYQLKKSFEQEKMHWPGPSGLKTFYFFASIARAISLIEQMTGKRWWEDRFTFLRMSDAILTALEIVEVEGREIVPKPSISGDIPDSLAAQIRARWNPKDMGHERMLMTFWMLEMLSTAGPELPRGAEPIGDPFSNEAAAHIVNLFMSSPEEAYSKLRRKRSPRQ